MEIKFTQFLMPDGRQRKVKITRPDDIVRKAEALQNNGCRFEIEMLMTGEISMTVERSSNRNGQEDEVLSHKICLNGPDVPINIDAMIHEAAEVTK